MTDETASTASLIDVDTPSVRTVPSDFGEQEVQTETQQTRIEREEQEQEEAAKLRAERELKEKAQKKKHQAKAKARKADSWLTKKFEGMSDGTTSALAVGNMLAVVGISGFLGYKTWLMYENRQLGWKNVGLGLGALGVVAAVESVFAG